MASTPRFISVDIRPSFTNKVAIITWSVTPELFGNEFYVYKKNDGGAEFELLNETPVYTAAFVDNNFYIPNKYEVPVYKILAVNPVSKVETESADIALFSEYSRRDFGLAHKMIYMQYLQAKADGVPVLYYPAVRSGTLNPAIDPSTGMRIQTYCGDDYGTYYEKGYYRPLIIYIRFIGQKRVKTNMLDEGIFDTAVQQCEFPAHPPVRTADLIVDPATDRRWLVGGSIEMCAVRNVIPVSYTAAIEQQDHSHPCYNVPIPDNYYALRKAMQGYTSQTQR